MFVKSWSVCRVKWKQAAALKGTKSCRTQGRISICLSVYPSICPYLCPASMGPSKSKSVHHGSHSSPFRYRPQRRGSKGQIWTLEVLGRIYIWTNRWTQILPCILQDFVSFRDRWTATTLLPISINHQFTKAEQGYRWPYTACGPLV